MRSEEVVDAALAGLEAVDRDAAQAARDAYESLTAGEGLQLVTGHGVADFLWYQLPTKWLCDLDEKLFLAAALGELFTRLDMPRYAAMCLDDTTAEIITAYETRGRSAGLKAYRAALSGSGLQPPDLPGVLEWGSVMGSEEAAPTGRRRPPLRWPSPPANCARACPGGGAPPARSPPVPGKPSRRHNRLHLAAVGAHRTAATLRRLPRTTA